MRFHPSKALHLTTRRWSADCKMKFLLCVGAEKAGTTWLHQYFHNHRQFHSCGSKEINAIQRDDLVPTFGSIPGTFQKNLNAYFSYFNSVVPDGMVSGDFTHYEGSTENIFRLLRDGFAQDGIEVVPVYIMREPVSRAWSAFNMLNQAGGGSSTSLEMPPAAELLLKSTLSCKYKETVEAIDNVFDTPIYQFYETMFSQDFVDQLCDRLGIERSPADFSHVNRGVYEPYSAEFIEKFGLTDKTKQAIDFIFERFDDVPWNKSNYA